MTKVIELSKGVVSERVRGQADRLAVRTAKDITRESHDQVRFCKFLNGRSVAYRVIEPEAGGIDPSMVILQVLEHQQGLTPQTYVNGLLIQRAFDTGNNLLVQIPQARLFDESYVLSAAERERVSEHGDFTPLADMSARVFEDVSADYPEPDARALIVGGSLGASVGAVLMKKVQTQHAVLFDAPNSSVRDAVPGSLRALLALKAAFSQTELGDLNEAVLDSDIEVLAKINGVKPDGSNSIRRLAGMTLYAAGCFLPQNICVEKGMTHDTFADDVTDCALNNPETTIAVARGEHSAIFTETSLRELMHRLDGAENVGYYMLKGYGHEAMNNTTMFASFITSSFADLRSSS